MVRSSQILQIVAEDHLCENAAVVGEYLKTQLENLAAKHSHMSNVRGRGLLCAFDFQDKAMRDAFIEKKGLQHNDDVPEVAVTGL